MFLLINSPLFKIAEENYDEDSLPPIGLGYIATNLQKNDIECELIDSPILTISAIPPQIHTAITLTSSPKKTS